MLHPAIVFGLGFAATSVFLTLTWAVQLKTKNAGIVDAVWSWSLGFLGGFYALLGDAPLLTRLVLGGFALVWGVRLGTHLFVRNHGKPEDRRYAHFREEWAPHTNRNMFFFFQLQAVIATVLSVGFLVVAFNRVELSWLWIGAGGVIWVASVVGEGIADWQLESFRKDPANKGKVCEKGLWYASRHPNYFFECLHWVAYVPLAIGSSWIWAALFPPLMMSWMLMKFSGVPLTERVTAKNRPGYAEYIRTTSALVPWFKKK